MAVASRTLEQIYDDPKLNDRPLYPAAEVARSLRVSPSTLRWWLKGRDHHRPVIDVADADSNTLSFRNLCEVWVLNSLRTRHRVPLQHIRHALDEIAQRTGVAHPLVEQRLLVDGRSLIFEHFGRIIGAGTGGQALFEQARPLLQRVQWNAQELECLFPVATTEPEADLRRIVIHPKVAFGRPTIASNGVPVEVFAPRWAAGESIEQLAQEFACTIDEVQDAMRFQFGSGLVA